MPAGSDAGGGQKYDHVVILETTDPEELSGVALSKTRSPFLYSGLFPKIFGHHVAEIL